MLMRRAAAFAKSGSEREVEEGYPEVGRSVRGSREESSVWGHVRPHCTSAKCHYRRKTWAFPRPRAHMHAHEASEQADTLTCYTAGEFARSTTRARPHHLTRRGPKGRAKSRGPEGTQGAPRKMRRQCAATPRACCPQPSLAAAAASLALSKTPAVLTSTRHASETTTAPGCCGGLTNPGAAETPRATLFFLELPLVSPCAQTSKNVYTLVQFAPAGPAVSGSLSTFLSPLHVNFSEVSDFSGLL